MRLRIDLDTHSSKVFSSGNMALFHYWKPFVYNISIKNIDKILFKCTKIAKVIKCLDKRENV